MTPSLSVILPAMLGFETVRTAIAAWLHLAGAAEIELLVLCPAAPAGLLAPPNLRVIETGSLLLHQARALGIRQARADAIFLAEDHCLPEPGFVGPILERWSTGEWDALAPALRSGNPVSAWTQASFLIGYGQWVAPLTAGAAEHLPGHNVLLRRSLLTDLGDDLERYLLVCSFLMAHLRRQGKRLGMEPRASMRHFDIEGPRSAPIFLVVGQGFGALRTQAWPGPARWLYGLATPAIAFRHWWRAMTHRQRTRAHPVSCLPAAAWLALHWAAGEALGAWRGVAAVTPHLWRSEVKPVQLP